MDDRRVRDYIHDLMNQLSLAEGWSKRIPQDKLDEKEQKSLEKVKSSVLKSIELTRELRSEIPD